MKVFTINASESIANIPFTAQETQFVQRSSAPNKSASQASIGVLVGSTTQSVLIETRPVAADKALKTQRLNRALQVGYYAPLSTTSSKIK